MDKFISKKIYKACKPEDTINRIKDIIKDNDIHLKEINFHHEESLTDASELRFDYESLDKTRIATNGKGMNETYSLASAYGEMMERIECDALMIDYQAKAYQKKDIDYLFNSDEKYVDALDYLNNNDIFEKILKVSKEDLKPLFKDKKLLVVPFYDVINDCETYLPWWAILTLTGSNGMCAGNNSKEAIAQGLNEIYERAALCQIYYDNTKLYKLDKKLFVGTEVLRKLEHLDTLGISSDIVDCSMGKNYPVIGLRLTTDEGMAFNLGADPNPIVALERCLSELYQTTNLKGLKYRLNKESCGTRSECKNLIEEGYYHFQFERSKRFGSGEKPDNVFYLSNEYSNNYAYNDSQINDFDYLTQLTKNLGYSLYVRDCSYLGFPAFITFIPELSTADYFDGYPLDKITNNFFDVTYKEKEGYDVMLSILKRLEEKKKKVILHQDKTML